MEAYRRFKEFMAGLDQSTEKLLDEKAVLLRQKNIFQSEWLAADLMEDAERTRKANEGLVLIKKKLDGLEAKLKALDIIPYAEKVYMEGSIELGKLVRQLKLQFDRVLEAKQVYLEEIRQLAQIRRKSQSIHNMTAECGKYVRRNPLDAIVIRGYSQFEISNRDLNSIIK